MDLIVLSPDKKVFEGKVNRISAPGVDGEFEVLDNHAPMVASLGNGTILITPSDTKELKNIAIQSGFIEVLDNKVSLLVQESKATASE
jgi:F-type H+-transporting ATPase subunit epsilon